MDLREELRSRLSIDQVVAGYCQLKKKGRNFVALCPFHNDSHPSFLVSPDKGIAYCFACQSGGDIFSFIQKIENVDFRGALKILAEKAGIDASQYSIQGPRKEEIDAMKETMKCLDDSALFYENNLQSDQRAKDYLDRRKITEELRKKFRIGSSKDSFNELHNFLFNKGYSKKSLLDSGLCIQRDVASAGIYDRFRNRLMFPIRSSQGDVIGFGGRTLGDDDAKYINSPEGPLYDKSSVLFGLFEGRDALRRTRTALIVEGYFDVLACHAVGVEHVVAASGTALTEKHIDVLKRYVDSVILCFDSDTAGRQASKRAFELLARAEIPTSFIEISGKDPAELWESDPEALKGILTSSPTSYLTFAIKSLRDVARSRDPRDRHRVREELFPLFGALKHATDLRTALHEAAESYGWLPSEMTEDFRRWTNEQRHHSHRVAHAESSEKTVFSSDDFVVGLAVLYPLVRPILSERIPTKDSMKDLFCSALIEDKKSSSLDSILSSNSYTQEFAERMRIVLLYCEDNFPAWSRSLVTKEFRRMLYRANKDTLAERQKKVLDEMKQARSAHRQTEEMTLLLEYQQLMKLGSMNEQALKRQ